MERKKFEQIINDVLISKELDGIKLVKEQILDVRSAVILEVVEKEDYTGDVISLESYRQVLNENGFSI